MGIVVSLTELTNSDTCILSQVKLQCKGQRLMQPRGLQRNVHVSLSWTLTRLQHFCNRLLVIENRLKEDRQILLVENDENSIDR